MKSMESYSQIDKLYETYSELNDPKYFKETVFVKRLLHS